MNQSSFEKATLKEKVYIVLEQGREISSRQFLYYNIKLYMLHDFFAEIWYIPSSNKIDKVETLILDEVLSIYRNDFDISSLLK
ncbi:MAG: hypothetical protein RBS53_03165 [Bacteroidales bacterium]|jgi:hypothetical protein|nr:hypothetical protein [Bacteroidales bacterium]NLM92434.1 hypothetical protein [Bacteroidales bacterium]